MSLESVRAITLDPYGTLLDVKSSMLQVCTNFLKAKGYSGDPGDVVSSWQTGYFQETMIDTLLGHGRTPFSQIIRSSLRQALAQLGIQSTSDELGGLLASGTPGAPFPDVTEGLLALKGRYTLVALSNGDQTALEQAVSNLSLPVDRAVSAEQAGVYKPHPAVYRTAVEQLGLEPSQVLHVAAHAWDIRGAVAFGMRGAYINRAGILYGDSPFQPDLEASDLLELAARIV
jgi:2-haloacid dehalogenase